MFHSTCAAQVSFPHHTHKTNVERFSLVAAGRK